MAGDRDAGRARELASEFGIQRTATNYSDILPDVDGVIVTVRCTAGAMVRAGQTLAVLQP